MKKILLIAAMGLLTMACSKEQEQEDGKVVNVTGISLNKTALEMVVGDEFTLIATIAPEDATDKGVNWSSDNGAAVTVSSAGLVRALKAGTATISATTADQGKKASCQVEVEEATGAVTGQATHISCRNAQISGKANLPGTMSTDVSFGVLYSTSSGILIGSATQIEAESFDSEYNYTIDTEVLEPETTYYYRSYLIQSGEVTYGKVKSFETLPLSSMIQTLAASEVKSKDATLNALLDLTDCKYSSLEYGFEVTPDDGSAHFVKASNLSDKKYSVDDNSLSIETGYSFVAYVKLDGKTYRGELETFVTTSVQASVTAESSNVSYFSATISGKVTVTLDSDFNMSAIIHYSNTASDLNSLKEGTDWRTL